MKSINAKYTDTTENLTFFALEKGWTVKITNTILVQDEENRSHFETEEIDNPITLDMFLTNFANDLLLREISQPILNYVDRVADEQANIQKEQYLNVLKENLEVIIN